MNWGDENKNFLRKCLCKLERKTNIAKALQNILGRFKLLRKNSIIRLIIKAFV